MLWLWTEACLHSFGHVQRSCSVQAWLQTCMHSVLRCRGGNLHAMGRPDDSMVLSQAQLAMDESTSPGPPQDAWDAEEDTDHPGDKPARPKSKAKKGSQDKKVCHRSPY